MSDKHYRFFGQVQEVNDKGETIDAGWSCLAKWVQYSDYARLKAENDRLRKAGDAMVEAFDLKYPVAGGVIKAWKEAKEGKPSA